MLWGAAGVVLMLTGSQGTANADFVYSVMIDCGFVNGKKHGHRQQQVDQGWISFAVFPLCADASQFGLFGSPEYMRNALVLDLSRHSWFEWPNR